MAKRHLERERKMKPREGPPWSHVLRVAEELGGVRGALKVCAWAWSCRGQNSGIRVLGLSEER